MVVGTNSPKQSELHLKKPHRKVKRRDVQETEGEQFWGTILTTHATTTIYAQTTLHHLKSLTKIVHI